MFSPMWISREGRARNISLDHSHHPACTFEHNSLKPRKRHCYQVLVEPRGFLGTNELCLPEEFYL